MMTYEYAATFHMADGDLTRKAADGWELVCCGQGHTGNLLLYWRRPPLPPNPSTLKVRHEREADGGRPFCCGALWWLTKDGDLSVRDLYRRHYSSRKSKRISDLVVGPGDKIVLRSACGDAAFVWRRSEHRRDGQTGVECTLFRNEGPRLSSLLIRQADQIADHVWPSLRHYTHVDAEAVRGDGGGACFRYAGWTHCGRTKLGLLIMERVVEAGRKALQSGETG